MRAAYPPQLHELNENAPSPHLMVVAPSDPKRAWVQHHNAMFRSDNAGRSWTELMHAQPSGFGFEVAVHPIGVPIRRGLFQRLMMSSAFPLATALWC
jgi:hypothetical protein